MGRKGRHRDELRTAHLAPASVPAAARRSEAGLVDRQRGGAPHGLWARRSAIGSAADIFREHARLSGFENDGQRDFDIGALATLSDEAFDALAPVQWPVPPATTAPDAALFRQRQLLHARPQGALHRAGTAGAPREAKSRSFPFHLNTGRVRDQWHTMTRTGTSPKLGVHSPEPFVEVHPADAEAAGLADGGFARVSTEHGSCVLKVVVSDGQQRGSLFVPIHWSDVNCVVRAGRRSRGARVTDPFSGQPEAKATPAAVSPVVQWSRLRTDAAAAGASRRHVVDAHRTRDGGFGLLIATNEPAACLAQPCAEPVRAGLRTCGIHRRAARRLSRRPPSSHGRLDGCLFVGPADAAPQWDTVKELFESETLERTRTARADFGTSGRMAYA